MVPLLCLLLLSSAFAPPPATESVIIEPGRDATLIEHPEGALANGSGPFFFAGRTNQSQNGTRRALLFFDLEAALPDDAILVSASLTLFLAPSNPGPRAITVHRVLADWGEGASASAGGGGAPAETGDVTWIHTFFDSEFWVRPGGQFVSRPSARGVVDAPGFYRWTSAPLLVRDVRLWQAAPHRNLGWILMGDETTPQTSKSFASREHPDPSFRPVLEITYRRPAEDD